MSSTSSSIKAKGQWSLEFFCHTPIGLAHVLNALYGAGFTVQIAMVPFLVMELGLEMRFNGYLLALFSFLQFVGAIIFGRMADWLGPRNAFVIALGCSATMFILMASAVNAWLLFLSQLPALFMQGFQAAALLICLETTEAERTPSIAYLNLSYGVGMVCGGFIGALLSMVLGPRATVLTAAMLSFLGIYIAFKLDGFPELDQRQAPPTPRDFWLSLKSEGFRMLSIIEKSLSICLLLMFGLLPILMTRFSFAPVAVDIFGITPTETAYLITYIGTLTVLAEGLLAPALATYFGDMACCRYSVALATLGYIGMVFAGGNKAALLVMLTLPLCAGALLYVCATSQMTKRVEKGEFGSVLGVNGAIFYFIAGCSPVIGLSVYASSGLSGYWCTCTVMSALLAAYIFFIDERTCDAYSKEYRTTTGGSIFQ